MFGAPLHPRQRRAALLDEIREGQVSRVEIVYEGIDSEEAEALAEALRNNQDATITDLTLTGNRMGQQFILGQFVRDGILESPILSSLTELRLKGNHLSCSTSRIQAGGALGEVLGREETVLRVLDLSNCALGDEGLREMLTMGFDRNESLSHLHLRKSELTLVGFAEQFGRAVSKLETLYLQENNIAMMEWMEMGLDRSTSLTMLHLSTNNLNDGDYEPVNESPFLFQGCARLRALHLTGNELKLAHGSLSASLLQNPSLVLLDLSANWIGNKGTVLLASALSDPTSAVLETLTLSSNEIGCQGAQALATMLKINKSLKFLRLDRNKISDEGAIALDRILGNGSNVTVREVDLKTNRISCAAIHLVRHIRFYTRCNNAGRYLTKCDDVPVGVWPFVLARVNHIPDVRNYLLRQKPEIMMRSRDDPE